MSLERVTITADIAADRAATFDWFYHSENFRQSPIVFRSKWLSDRAWIPGAKRDIIMIAGRYMEEITQVDYGKRIAYRVYKSYPKVQQDFTEICFESLSPQLTRVTWTIEVAVPGPLGFLSKLARNLAGTLYGTILRAGKKALEVL